MNKIIVLELDCCCKFWMGSLKISLVFPSIYPRANNPQVAVFKERQHPLLKNKHKYDKHKRAVESKIELMTLVCTNDNYHFSREEFLKNLELKRNHQAFQSDMHALLPVGLNWNFEESYQFVVDNVISRLL